MEFERDPQIFDKVKPSEPSINLDDVDKLAAHLKYKLSPEKMAELKSRLFKRLESGAD